jgi:hypothetical protein
VFRRSAALLGSLKTAISLLLAPREQRGSLTARGRGRLLGRHLGSCRLAATSAQTLQPHPHGEHSSALIWAAYTQFAVVREAPGAKSYGDAEPGAVGRLCRQGRRALLACYALPAGRQLAHQHLQIQRAVQTAAALTAVWLVQPFDWVRARWPMCLCADLLRRRPSENHRACFQRVTLCNANVTLLAADQEAA